MRTPKLAAGTRVGPYEIASALGAGAMGEVYRARDRRLERDVAIKVIPEALAFDAERVDRFSREAQVLASLNHPNIAAIYGLEQEGGRQALVLELVEGVTLAERIARRPVPLDEALAIARQIAEALEAAHEQGIVHRDLKPANVKLTPQGMVKVLDFGLATPPPSSRADMDLMDERTVLATMPGVVLGTAQYMSPEQALGKATDRGSDVWAFGCVLFEMLARQHAFEGQTVGEVLAGVLKSEPDWSRLPAATPEGIRRLLRRCLRKKPSDRLRDIRDARLEIDDVLSGASGDADAPRTRSPRVERVAWAAALVLVALAAVALGSGALRQAPAPERRLEINTPPSADAFVALSPDGRNIAFAAESGGGSQLWLRPLGSLTATPLPGTAGAITPFWSADGRSIGFFARTRLMRIDLDARSVSTVVPVAEVPMGAAWNADDIIVFSPRPGLALHRVAAAGGEPAPVTSMQAGHDGYYSPQFLPDGRHFLFFATGAPGSRGVHVGRLDDMAATRLFDADTPAVYASTGHLLFVREGALFAQAFDADRLELVGEPFAIADGLSERTSLAASAAGPIAYRTPPRDSGQRELVWVDRAGGELARVVYQDASALGPALSPDGRYVGVFRFQNDNMDLWTYDTLRRLWDRITVGAYHEIYALWFADGERMVFASNQNGRLDLYSKLLSAPAGEGEELLLSTTETKWPMDLSRDGRFLLYTNLSSETGADIWALPLAGDRVPQPVVRTEFIEQLPQLSPDGAWVAYQSDRTGRFEVYVRRFPGPANDTRVSLEGGGQPRWSHDGSELFYVAEDDWMMAVPLRAAADGELEPDAPVALFQTRIGSTAPNHNRHQYAVAPDGSFVLNAVAGATGASPITVLLNWAP